MTGSGTSRAIDSSKLSSAKVNKIYAVFRNAKLTDYYGMTGEGQTGGIQCIYWEGVQGSRKVILRKVNSSYDAVKDKTFVLYKGSSDSAYVVKDGNKRTQLGGTNSDTTVTVDPMKSLESGVIWIGSLPYGWYIIEETGTTPKYFYLVVTDKGTYGTLDEDGKDKVNGYGTRADAETQAIAVYNSNK